MAKATKNSPLKNQVYENMRLKETDELIEIWKRNNREVWSDTAFESVKELLLERLGKLPEQEIDPRDESHWETINSEMITTTLGFDGYKTKKYLGVVRGITVRSTSIGESFNATVQQIFGGQISDYIKMCEAAREEAYDLMMEHAQELGANAIISMKYDTTEIVPGVAEVLAYGTAVIVEPAAN